LAEEERNVKPKLRKILRKPAVMEATGYGETQIDELVKQDIFPAPIPLSPNGRAVGWLEDEVAAYQAARIAERDRQKKR
jgi:prophage regulatory protein